MQASKTPDRRVTIHGYELRMLGYTVILPVTIAADFMQELWTDVVRAANERLQQGSRDDFFAVSLGLTVASFQSLDGPLDWQTIIVSAIEVINEVGNGHCGLWRAALRNDATNAVMGVLLTSVRTDVIPYGYPEWGTFDGLIYDSSCFNHV